VRAVLAVLCLVATSLSPGCLLDCASKPARSVTLDAPGLYEALTDQPAAPPPEDPMPDVPGLGRVLPAADAFVKEFLWQAPGGAKLRMIPPFPPYDGNLTAKAWVQSGQPDVATARAFLGELVASGHSSVDGLATELAGTTRTVVSAPFDLGQLYVQHPAVDDLTRTTESWEFASHGLNFSAVWIHHLEGGWTVWWALRDHSFGGEEHHLRYHVRVDAFDHGYANVANLNETENPINGTLAQEVVAQAISARGVDPSTVRFGPVEAECYVNLQ